MTKAAFGVKNFISASSSVFLYLRCFFLTFALQKSFVQFQSSLLANSR
jgi:hypothetical protein